MHVSVADDENDLKSPFGRHFIRMTKIHEFEFRFAYSGEVALEYLSIHSWGAVLIRSDINLPSMNGTELLKHVKSMPCEALPIVMMVTAYSETHNYNSAMKPGGRDFLPKPLISLL